LGDAGSGHVVVVGAGVAGLGTALALARDGHRVTLLERDATPLPADADAAFDWDRRSAPQVRHSHALLARLRNLLRDRFPDVLDRLLAAGATEIRFCDLLPESLADRTVRPGDDELVALACRRTTFEMVLRHVVVELPGVHLRHGTAVNGLVAGAGGRGVPRVEGVLLDDGTHLRADATVAAVGRRSAVPSWLARLGVHVPVTEEDTGIVYLSRFYRLRPGAEFPDAAGPIGGDLGYLKYGVFQGDNRTYSITLAVRSTDHPLRAALLRPDTFDQAARILSATAPWAEPDRADAITPVHVMGGLVNRVVDYLGSDGEPLVLGFHAVGDAHTCTNPLYGRGCSLAMVQATLLADAWAAEVGDEVGRSVRYEADCRRQIRPWYDAAVNQDRFARIDRDPHAEHADRPEGDDVTPQDLARQILRDGLLPAVQTDPEVFRGFIRTFNLLCPPDTLLVDGDLFSRVLAAYNDRENRPDPPVLGPPRREMVEALRS
jgi:2-polyprenyl-6-methoxyphenol hydroxylase-like FAD-dependent oxidoreductase